MTDREELVQLAQKCQRLADEAPDRTSRERFLELARVFEVILFGAYHWWTGIGNIIEAVLIGALLMLFYRRSTALWPVVLAHYLTDVVDFVL